MAHILVAEDERDIRELINFTLMFAGHTVTLAANGAANPVETTLAKAPEPVEAPPDSGDTASFSTPPALLTPEPAPSLATNGTDNDVEMT